MRDMLATLVRLLVDEPEAVRIERTEIDGMVRYDIHVAPADVGRVIGRQGRVIRALRVVMRSVGSRSHNRVEIELADGRS